MNDKLEREYKIISIDLSTKDDYQAYAIISRTMNSAVFTSPGAVYHEYEVTWPVSNQVHMFSKMERMGGARIDNIDRVRLSWILKEMLT